MITSAMVSASAFVVHSLTALPSRIIKTGLPSESRSSHQTYKEQGVSAYTAHCSQVKLMNKSNVVAADKLMPCIAGCHDSIQQKWQIAYACRATKLSQRCVMRAVPGFYMGACLVLTRIDAALASLLMPVWRPQLAAGLST